MNNFYHQLNQLINHNNIDTISNSIGLDRDEFKKKLNQERLSFEQCCHCVSSLRDPLLFRYVMDCFGIITMEKNHTSIN